MSSDFNVTRTVASHDETPHIAFAKIFHCGDSRKHVTRLQNLLATTSTLRERRVEREW